MLIEAALALALLLEHWELVVEFFLFQSWCIFWVKIRIKLQHCRSSLSVRPHAFHW